MIRKLYNKYFQTSKTLQKMNAMRKRIRAAYWVLTDHKVNLYESNFKRQIKQYDLSPDELHSAREFGFYPRSYMIYDFKKWGMAQFFTERDLRKLDFRERGITPAIVGKRNLPILLLKKAHYLPSLNIAIDRGSVQYIIEDGSYQERDFDLEELLQRCLKKYEKLIVKPHSLNQGRGIFLISNTLTGETVQRIKMGGG